MEIEMDDVAAPNADRQYTAQHVQMGMPMTPRQRLLAYSADEWEEFISEWVGCLEYKRVVKPAGSGDLGVDVAGFTDEHGFGGVWDCFQCKHYRRPLRPSDAVPEVAKIIWHSFNRKYEPPRKYRFVAPSDCVPALQHMLSTPDSLRNHVLNNWDKRCATAVTSGRPIPLNGEFEVYVKQFDFSIFDFLSSTEILEGHKKTRYHAVRFGCALQPRPENESPPHAMAESEHRYVEQLREAYGDHLKKPVAKIDDLQAHPQLTEHLHRQRQAFYCAESLEKFARDTVPEGTFDNLKDEVRQAVIETAEADHDDGYARVTKVLEVAVGAQITSNALISVVKPDDRKGICHHLANEDRVRWVK